MTRRANPAASLDCAARHLFRHLHDVGSLRRNPLVAHLVRQSEDSAPAIDAVVGLAAEYRRASKAGNLRSAVNRELAVFTRAVVYREPWGRVAADLGVSRRQ